MSWPVGSSVSWPEGDHYKRKSYEGNFKDNAPHGSGKLTYYENYQPYLSSLCKFLKFSVKAIFKFFEFSIANMYIEDKSMSHRDIGETTARKTGHDITEIPYKS